LGDIHTLTVREYRRLPPWRRAGYRLFRNPVLLLVVGPPLLFLLKYRVPPSGLARSGEAWRSAMSTNLAVAAVAGLAAALAGPRDFALVHAPILWLSSSVGVWLFYVQHQFEHAYWEGDEGWSVHAGALRGSSHLELPGVLRWLTANIGVHHVHHLCSRIPSYRLGEVLRDHPELRGVNRLTLGDSLRCLRLALWDEDAGRMVGFRDAKAGG
jgi:omega-6 fatty acid desaturase (delta-12 desaturase)